MKADEMRFVQCRMVDAREGSEVGLVSLVSMSQAERISSLPLIQTLARSNQGKAGELGSPFPHWASH
jgi:hypothetical protein